MKFGERASPLVGEKLSNGFGRGKYSQHEKMFLHHLWILSKGTFQNSFPQRSFPSKWCYATVLRVRRYVFLLCNYVFAPWFLIHVVFVFSYVLCKTVAANLRLVLAKVRRNNNKLKAFKLTIK